MILWFVCLIILTLVPLYNSLPNIMVITVEDLGFDDVSWNNPSVIMPHIATLARSGVILNQAYAQPTGSSSQAAFLTGLYSSRTGHQFSEPNNMEPVGLPASLKILPEYLAPLGYTSHALGRWALGYCAEKYLPTRRGFKSFYGTWNGGGNHQTHITPADPRSRFTTLGYDFHKDEDYYLGAIGTYTTDLIVDRLSDLISEHHQLEQGWFSGYPSGKVKLSSVNESSPLFLFLNFESVKMPLQVDEKFENMYPYVEDETRKKFLGMVSALDDAIGRIVNHLKRFTYYKNGKETNMYDETVIIFTSTNGGLSQGPVNGGSSNLPFSGGKGDMFEGGCSVPAFITNINNTGIVQSLFHITDWFPTIYVGLARGLEKNVENIDGINQMSVLQGHSEPLRSEVLYDVANFAGSEHTLITTPDWPEDFELTGAFGAALRVNNYKVILGCGTRTECARNYNGTWNGNIAASQIRMFDLTLDPEERVNLAGSPEHTDLQADILSRLRQHVAKAVTPNHAPTSSDGLPIYSFPPGQFFTGWCQ